MGTCLELDPSTLMIQMPKTKKVSLGFTFGVNISGKIGLTDFYQSLNRPKITFFLKMDEFEENVRGTESPVGGPDIHHKDKDGRSPDSKIF